MTDILDDQNKHSKKNYIYFDEPQDLLNGVLEYIVETDVVLDIGPGIKPMNYFRPKLHILVEPWGEYSDILSYRHADDKSVLILKSRAIESLVQLQDNSIDSIFLLDVIEHLEKNEGIRLLLEMERVARRQIVIFTPLGFMPQHMEDGEKDGWGLSGGKMQEHRSGWTPDDFAEDWHFYICETFHRQNFRSNPLDRPHGAFFAIRNFLDKTTNTPSTLSDIRRPLPSEISLYKAQDELQTLKLELNKIMDKLDSTRSELDRTRSELAVSQSAVERSSSDLAAIRKSLTFRASRTISRLLGR